jgi:mannose-6-phosphate isomerase-like protein (cupin superfamily)
MENLAIKNPGRRNFLRTAPVVAAAGLALADASLFASQTAGPSAAPDAPAPFQLFTAQAIQEDSKALQANPGNNNLVGGKNFTIALTTEKTKSGVEYEVHEHRDHVLQILDGTTVYEVGGTLKNAHNTGPGEWRASAADGTTTLTLNKGDMLIIPRGTSHKRSTAASVTLLLISPMGNVTA